ncbi:hypothetical protein FH972_006369 [Carpinus fangiana]|uniref:Uncharacterized protein n=1 Tax=Carpinus fangiana TaxID=176857 RepID=A0A5N6QTX7_9ROSI|nr:hypothetical protein FH972_006369 [Carpinus fangiana]
MLPSHFELAHLGTIRRMRDVADLDLLLLGQLERIECADLWPRIASAANAIV